MNCNKLYALTLGAAILAGAGSAFSATPALGVRAGMELSFPSGATSLYSTGAGLNLGAVARFDLPKSFFFEPGLYFNYMGMSAKYITLTDDGSSYNSTTKLYSLRLALMPGWNTDLSELTQMSVSTGPYVNFNLSARSDFLPNMSAPDHLPDQTVNLFRNGWRRVDAGWGIRLNFTFAESYYIGVSGGVAFTPLAQFGNKDKKMRIHRNVAAITLGYNF